MLVVMSIIISIGGILHTFTADIYLMYPTSWNPETTSHDDLSRHLNAAFRADSVAMLLSMIGIFIVKLSFMLFFYRLGHKVSAYNTVWWVAVVVIMACGGVQFGLNPTYCLFGDLAVGLPGQEGLGQCLDGRTRSYIYSAYKVNVVVDILSDLIS